MTTNKQPAWEKELRLNLDDIFEDAHSYTGPNIDETFDRVFQYSKHFIKQQQKKLLDKLEKVLKKAKFDHTDFDEDGYNRLCKEDRDDVIKKLKEGI